MPFSGNLGQSASCYDAITLPGTGLMEFSRMNSRDRNKHKMLSRRAVLKGMSLAPMAFRAAPFFGFPFLPRLAANFTDQAAAFPFADVRLSPHYPAKSPLADALRLVAPGSDGYLTEKYAFEIETILKQWSQALCASARGVSAAADWLGPAIDATAFSRATEVAVRNGFGIDVVRRRFGAGVVQGPEKLLGELQTWLGPDAKVETAEFEIYGIEATGSDPPAVRTDIRYDIVTARGDGRGEERVGSWQMDWRRDPAQGSTASRWRAGEETVATLRGPGFIDVTRQALGREASYKDQLLLG